MKIREQTIQNMLRATQGIDFNADRSREIAAEVTNLLDAVDEFSELMHFDCEPLHFHGYVANGKGIKA